jgi:hypothetical protein
MDQRNPFTSAKRWRLEMKHAIAGRHNGLHCLGLNSFRLLPDRHGGPQESVVAPELQQHDVFIILTSTAALLTDHHVNASRAAAYQHPRVMFGAMELEINLLLTKAQTMDFQQVNSLRKNGLSKQNLYPTTINVTADGNARNRF